jgi:hypothetical protein
MRLLTTFPHGSIPLDYDRSRCVDGAEIGVCRSHDRVELTRCAVGNCAGSGLGASAEGRIRLHDHDFPAGELERRRVDAGEAELEHAARPLSEQLDDLRRGGGGESWREPVHRYARYMSGRGPGKFLGVPYDWRRPTRERFKSRWWNPSDRRIVMPRAFGWGYDFNFAEIARRLGLKH